MLIQPEGQTWRAVRVPLSSGRRVHLRRSRWACSAAFYMLRGTIGRARQGRRERIIERFRRRARRALVRRDRRSALAITGLILSLGKAVLLPLIGYTLFSWLAISPRACTTSSGRCSSSACRSCSCSSSRQRVERARTTAWFAKIIGILKGDTYPSDKAQCRREARLLARAHLGLDGAVVSGLILVFPNFDQTRSTMQVANIVHAVAAYLSIAPGVPCTSISGRSVSRAPSRDARRLRRRILGQGSPRDWYQRIVAGKEPRRNSSCRKRGKPSAWKRAREAAAIGVTGRGEER